VWAIGRPLTLPQVEKPRAGSALTSYIKGAPERVLAKCSHYLVDGRVEPVTEAFQAQYDEAYNVRCPRSSPCTAVC
jgi:sodium/potassium-transporting ATPase subunit alpha